MTTGLREHLQRLETARDEARAKRQAILDRCQAEHRKDLTADEATAFHRLTGQIEGLDELVGEQAAEVERAGLNDPEKMRIRQASSTGGSGGCGSAAESRSWAQRTAQTIAAVHGEARAVVSGSIDVPSLVEANVAAIPHPSRLIDLFTNRIAVQGNAFEFYQQTARVNAATAVADAATKPTSTLTIQAVQDRCRVVAHLSEAAPIRLLADIPAFQNWLVSEMVAGVLDGLEAQIVNGSGTGENMRGLLNTTGVTAVAFTTNMVTSLRAGLTALQVKNEVPTGWALHPADAQSIDLTRWGAEGGLLTGGFQTDTRPGVSGSSDNIFGSSIPRVVSPSVPVGTAILGDFTQLRVYVREGARVDIDTSGPELFDKNLFKMRGEGRFGIGVLRPQAFAIIDLTA
jgi:HK97 family phage major capsid protein